MKKVFALLLSLCLVIIQIPMPIHAVEIAKSGECGKNPDVLTWQFTDDGTLTISGKGKMSDYNQYDSPWSELKVKHVVIEEGVSYIGDRAFRGLPYLQTVTVADSVKEIGDSAFANCDKLVSVTLGSGLEKTGVSVFSDCDALVDFTFPNTDVYYGNSMFSGCNSLKNVVIPEKMTRIGEGMFLGCTSLESIIIPDTVTDMGSVAFSNTALKEITIPDSVTKIGAETFSNCRYLKSITLPNTLQSMSNSVFQGCQVLKTVTIPASVTSLSHTFQNTYCLESVKFLGNAPTAASHLFGYITVTVYYPENNPSWTEDVKQNYSGTVTWVPYESETEINDVIASGACGESVNWKLTNTWTLEISGEGKMPANEHPWREFSGRIEHIVIKPGITSISNLAFYDCKLAKSISIADTVVNINSSAFCNCSGVTELVIPGSVKEIGHGAFSGMADLKTIRFLGDVPVFNQEVFRSVTAGAIYPEDNDTWTEDKLQDYGGLITWWESGHVHDYEQITVNAACTKKGYHANYCDICGYLEILSYIEPLEHDFSNLVCGEKPYCTREGCDYQYSLAVDHDWDDYCSQIRHCVRCGIEDHNGGHLWDGAEGEIRACVKCKKMEGGYRLYLNMATATVFIDGEICYAESGSENGWYVDLPTNTAQSMVIYEFNQNADTQSSAWYPSGMEVWTLSCEGDYYTATYVPEFKDLLQYAGSSIRITGTKGIRMITSIEKSKKEALTGKGLAGYKLVEYGTVLAWEKLIGYQTSLTLDKNYAKSNYAYKRGVADPIFAQTDTLMQYTNVLVGFNLNQCKDDIAMRPYIILEDANGKRMTLYGGTVIRSIGYIAYQNRNVFKPGTSSYDYVWEIIHHVYGDKYDPDYQG